MIKQSRMLLAVMAIGAGVGAAQTAAVASPAGTVAGTIVFGDTQRPARFAKVSLTPMKSDADTAMQALTKKKDGDVDPKQAFNVIMGGLTLLTTQTDLEGRYELSGVAPGDYYVVASVPGYVTQGLNADDHDEMSLRGAPTVHVEANHTVRGDETLERGGIVSGKVLYDDGSPVTGVLVQAISAKKKEKVAGDSINPGQIMMASMNGGLKTAMTDDRGVFRIAGLIPGEYRVKVDISLAGNQSIKGGVINVSSFRGASKMTVYAPATQHEVEGKKLVVKAEEETGDLEVRVNLAGTHQVSGHLASAVDHHLLNQGTVTLVDATDKEVKRSAAVQPDGSFSVLYVPNGSYELTVTEAADTISAPKKEAKGLLNFAQDKVVKSYEPVTVTEVVADHDVLGVSLEVKESAKVKPEVDLNGLFGASGNP